MTQTTVQNLADLLDRTMLRDRHTLRRRLRGIERSQQAGREVDHGLSQVAADIERSVRRREDRQKAVPRPTYPEHLPVVERRDEIKEAIAKHQVIVLCGD